MEIGKFFSKVIQDDKELFREFISKMLLNILLWSGNLLFQYGSSEVDEKSGTIVSIKFYNKG